MKRIAQILATIVLSIGVMGGVASAAPATNNNTGECNVTVTGDGSDTDVTCNEDVNNTVRCENNVTVANNNTQNANSGNASNNNNRVGGFSTTGSVSNSNTATVQLGIACSPIATASTATPTSPTTSAAPAAGRGAGEAAPAAPAASAQVASLPETGSSSVATIATISAGVLVAGAAATQFAPAAIRRFNK